MGRQRSLDDEGARLDEFDKDEWMLVCKRLKPGISDLDYEKMWEEFQATKAEYLRNKELN